MILYMRTIFSCKVCSWLALARLLPVFLYVIAFSAFAADETPTALTPPLFVKGPYLQAPGADTMTIMWESWTNSPAVVHLGLRGRPAREARLESPWMFEGISQYSTTNITDTGKTNVTKHSLTNSAFMYEVTLTNLQPGSLYYYSVELAGSRTPPKKFKTFGGNPDKVNFIAYGDTRSFPKIHARVASNFKKHSPEFILHTGDLVGSGKRYDQWGKEFFAPLAGVMDEVPLLAAIGNHEDDGTNYFRFLHLPGKERWYSFEVGPVHVLALDYRFQSETNEQFRFASQDLLGARTPWKIVMLHYPVFNVGGHDTAWGHKAYLPLFHEAKVDMVIAGHSHLYERFRPIASREKGDWPITHITTGGGGAELATSYQHPALVSRSATNHYIAFEATREAVRGRVFTAGGALIDSFEIKKPKGRPTPEYLASVYPEEWLNISFDASTNLLGRLASVPNATNSAKVMFTLAPLKTTPRSIDMEITLTPESARYYTLPEGPLRVTTPAEGGSNSIVWATISVTGKKKVTGAVGKELSPPLIFEARVKADDLETFAYGPHCRVSATAVAAEKKLEPEAGSN
jgi:predicted phosphodiesterase